MTPRISVGRLRVDSCYFVKIKTITNGHVYNFKTCEISFNIHFNAKEKDFTSISVQPQYIEVVHSLRLFNRRFITAMSI